MKASVMDLSIATDAFNILCGRMIGEGIHRQVFECKLLPECVVKVEYEPDYRHFANVREMDFWSNYRYMPKVAEWLAPCEFLSPDGRILIQKRADPIKESDIPEMLPAWITDVKAANFGRIDGKLVLVDYALVIMNPVTRLRKW